MFFNIGKIYAGVGNSGSFGQVGTSVSVDLSEDLYEGVYQMKKDIENVINSYPTLKNKFERVCDPRKSGSALTEAEIKSFFDLHKSKHLDAVLRVIVRNEGGSQSFGLRNGMVDTGNFVILSKSKLVDDDCFSTNVLYNGYYVYIFGTATGGITGCNLPGVKDADINSKFRQAILSDPEIAKKTIKVKTKDGTIEQSISKFGLTDIFWALRNGDIGIPVGNSLTKDIYLINLGRASKYTSGQLGCLFGLFDLAEGEFSINPNNGYCVHSIKVHDYLKYLFSQLKNNVNTIVSCGIVDPVLTQYLLDVSWHRGAADLKKWAELVLPHQGKVHSSNDLRKFGDIIHLKKYEYRLGAYVYV